MRTALTRSLRALADSLRVSSHQAANQSNNHSSNRSGNRSGLGQDAINSVIEPLEQRTLMSTYYISPTGSDSNAGTTISKPWKSISKVNSSSFKAGDSVLFQGGQTFYGSLNLGSKQSGSSTNPVTFGSYSGEATISSGKSAGAIVQNAGGIWFENLTFVGTPNSEPQSGIDFEGYTAGVYYGNLKVDHCSISGYWLAGILFEASHTNGGISGLQITNNQLFNNIESGIDSAAPGYTSLQNIYIAYNTVHDNTGYGNGSGYISGNGIELGDVSNVMVEYNSAFHNGANGGDGGVGIWAYSANNVTFQYNESYNNITRGGNDGDGFDFDADVSNSVIQYNYAFGNDGTGAQLDQWRNNNLFYNDIVRYNVFQDNGLKNNYGNLEVWGKVINADLYNNTIYTVPGNSGINSAIRVHNSTIPNLYVNGVHFVNNIIESANGANLINVTAGEAQGAQNLTFDGNVYWSNGNTPTFIYGSHTVHSLAQWQALGQETVSGVKVGLFADPKLVAAGAGGVVSLSILPNVPQYALLSTTPILNVGVNLAIISDGTTKTVPGAEQGTIAAVTPKPVIPGGSGSVSGGLIGVNIGSVVSGSDSISGSSITLTGGGAVLGGTADDVRYVYSTLTGSGEIIAQVSGLSNVSGSAVAGLMIRSSNAANSQSVALVLNNANQVWQMTRATTGGNTSYNEANSNGSEWLELSRSGSTINAYISANGVTWTLIETVQVNLSNSVEIGVVTTSQSTTTTETAVMQNVAAA